MAVKVGNSWVSEAAMAYAKEKVNAGSNGSLDELSEQYPEERKAEKKATYQSEDSSVVLELSQETQTAQANTTTETHGGAVAFNEGKRARQLAAAKTVENIQTVMSILQTDLVDCQAGLESGMCDENEVNKVKAMIAKAQQRLSEVSASGDKENNADENAFAMSMLM